MADSLPLETVEKAVVTNAMAPTLLTQAFLKAIIKNKGNILFIGEQERQHIPCPVWFITPPAKISSMGWSEVFGLI